MTLPTPHPIFFFHFEYFTQPTYSSDLMLNLKYKIANKVMRVRDLKPPVIVIAVMLHFCTSYQEAFIAFNCQVEAG